MATIRAKIPHRNIVSEPEFFKNQTTNYPSLVSRRKWSFEGLNVEEITSLRSLEDEYGTISGLSLSLVRTSVETASHRNLSSSDLHGMIPSKFKPSKLDFLPDTRLG